MSNAFKCHCCACNINVLIQVLYRQGPQPPKITVFSHFLLDVRDRSHPFCSFVEYLRFVIHIYPRGFDYPYSIFLSRNDLRILLSSIPKQRLLCRISGQFQGIERIEVCRWQATILVEKRVGEAEGSRDIGCSFSHFLPRLGPFKFFQIQSFLDFLRP